MVACRVLVVLAATASAKECGNNKYWYAKKKSKTNCKYVKKNPEKYCKSKMTDDDGVDSWTACAKACDACDLDCSSDADKDDWFAKKSKKDCDWVGEDPETRCKTKSKYADVDNFDIPMPASVACPEACGTSCEGVGDSAETMAPTKAPVSSAQCLENGEIIQAVRKYVNNADNGMFGPIEDWGTSCVDDMASLFYYEKDFNGDVSSWDVGQVTSFSSTFRGARRFNADVSGWDTGSATNVNSMFYQAVNFNGNVAAWNVNKVVQIESMFESAVKFDSDLSGWNVNKVTSMCYMLDNTQCEDDDNCGLGDKFIFCDDDDDDD